MEKRVAKGNSRYKHSGHSFNEWRLRDSRGEPKKSIGRYTTHGWAAVEGSSKPKREEKNHRRTI